MTRTIDYTPHKLQTLADKLSRHFWQKPCDIPVQWNGRLTRTMGRFLFAQQGETRTPVRIECSKHAALFMNREIFVAVLLHELCHYHLFCEGKPFADHHPVFEKELRRVGAISTNRVQIPQKVFRLSCLQCGLELGMRRRFNADRYLSACCRSRVKKEQTWQGTFRYDGQILQNSKVRILSAEDLV